MSFAAIFRKDNSEQIHTKKAISTKLITENLLLPSHTLGCEYKMTHKRNVVLYLDADLVAKTKELGFNLSKTVENHLKHLVNCFPYIILEDNSVDCVFGSPGEIRTLVSGSRARHA